MIQYFPIVTGSLTVLGNINVSGSITTSGSITISGSITSASFASTASYWSGSITNASSSSFASTASFVALAQSASFVANAQTASFVANAQTASYVLNAVSSSFASTASFVALAQSASNAVSAVTASFANNLTVAGTLTAQTLVVQTITSSVDFVTGSTRFGSLLTNTHVFSGSVTMNPGGLFVSSSGAVGIGVIPTQTSSLVFADTLSSKILFNNNANNYRIDLTSSISGGDAMMKFIAGSTGAGEVGFYTTTNLRMIIASSGNVGIGTSSPVTLDSGGVNLQIKDRSALFQLAAVNSTYLSNNIYYDGSWKRIVSGYGALIRLNDDSNGFSFLTTGTGGANSAVTFTSAMNITNAGNVGIGFDTPAYKLDVSGSIRTIANLNMTGTSSQILQTTANSIAGDNVAVFYNSNANSYGMYIGAGTGTNHALYITNAARNADLFKVQGNGQVFIGATSALFNTLVNINYNQSTYEGLALSTDKVYNGSPQPNLIFGGKYNSAGDYRQHATIQSIKDNATSGDSAASLVFNTNGNSASVTERMRISSAGYITTPAQPAFYAYLPGGATTTTTGNYAGFNTTRLNRGSHYNTSTGRFTAPIAGVYRFLFAALYRRQSGTSSGEISISINGSNVNTRGLAYVVNNIADGHTPIVAELIISLSASDYVMPFIHSVGASSDFYVGENLAYFCGYLIG